MNKPMMFEEFWQSQHDYFTKSKIGEQGDDEDGTLICYLDNDSMNFVSIQTDYSTMVAACEHIHKTQPKYYFFMCEIWGTSKVTRAELMFKYGNDLRNVPAKLKYEQLWLFAGRRDSPEQKYAVYDIIRSENGLLKELKPVEMTATKNRLQGAYSGNYGAV